LDERVKLASRQWSRHLYKEKQSNVGGGEDKRKDNLKHFPNCNIATKLFTIPLQS